MILEKLTTTWLGRRVFTYETRDLSLRSIIVVEHLGTGRNWSVRYILIQNLLSGRRVLRHVGEVHHLK